MTYENRLPVNYAFGTLTQAAAISDTTLTSTDFAAGLPAGLSTTTYVPITLQDPSTKAYEIVWANAHPANAATATVLRGREGTSARAWGSGTLWAVAPTLRDGLLPVSTRTALPADAHVGLRAFVQDEQVTVEKTLAQGWISTSPNADPKASLIQNVVQQIPHNIFTPITFDSEVFDSFSGHDPVNNTRFTVPTGWAGTYILAGGVSFDVNGNFSRGCAWAKNGALINGSQSMIASAGTLVYTLVTARTIGVPLAVGDYIELHGYHNAGAPLNTAAGSSMLVRYDGP